MAGHFVHPVRHAPLPHISVPHSRLSRARDSLALADLATSALIIVVLVTGAVAAIVADVTVPAAARPWPVEFSPSLGELGVMTSGEYWAEEYMPSLEELAATVSPLSEFNAMGGAVKCDGCHRSFNSMYPSGDPLAAHHLYAEEHREECDCISCHIPPHSLTVAEECKCCDCHSCWNTGWAVKKSMCSGDCAECHDPR